MTHPILDNLARIPLRKLFLVTITCKILASLLAWQLGSPWILGFTVPLAFMAAYIVLGFGRADSDVSDEKFGDSCYYLGFIFTISSIAFSLFDIPYLDQAGRLAEVAVRFGAAMISTFVGFIVRVYLVGFRDESTGALQSLENQIIESANRLKTRLDLSQDAFEHFEQSVRQAANDSEARMRMAVENAGRHLSQEMAQALKALVVDVQAVHTAAAGQMGVAAQTLAADLTKCSQALVANIEQAQAHFVGMADSLETRLRAITFPDDYFTKELAPSVSDLVASMAAVGSDLKSLRKSVNTSIKGLSAALEKVDVAMETPQSVRDLVQRQEIISKQVLEVISLAGRIVDGSASAIKEQNAVLARLSAEFTAAQLSQSQVLANTRQTAQELASAQEDHHLVIENLGHLIKQLEQLPAELRKHLVLLPAATNILTPAPQPHSPDDITMPAVSPISRRPVLSPSTNTSDDTQTVSSTRGRMEHSKSSFWDNMFRRNKE